MSKRIRITNESVNSYGFRVLTQGIDLEQYRRNPVLLYMHVRGDVIGYVKDFEVKDGEITAALVFDEASELSRRCKIQYEIGSLRMVSIGLDVIETSDDAKLLLPGQTRPTVTRSKLVEVSLVDVGANDDAIVLHKEGSRITLSNDGDCLLPVIVNNPTNQTTTMDLKKIALELGLPETADEATILTEIARLKREAGMSVTLKAENATLKLAGITTLVDAAIADKRLTSEHRDHFVELGKKVGAAELEKTLKAMVPRVKLSAVVGHQGAGAQPGVYTKLSEVPEAELAVLRRDDKATYKRLFRAEYGYDCEIED